MVSEDDESFVAAFTLRTSAPRVKSFNDRAAHHEMRKSSPARSVQAGAVGYISKGSDPQELVRAAKAALAGGAICRPKHRGHPSSMTTADCRTKPCQIGYQVLRMIGQGLTVSEIATELSLSVKTVSTYRARILEKTRMRTNAELMRYVITHALVPWPPS